MTQFFWSGIHGDVLHFCRLCNVFQRAGDKWGVTRAPLQQMELIDRPFKRVAVDVVEPITPASDSSKRCILTVIDYVTMYPDAVALARIRHDHCGRGLYSYVELAEEIICGQSPSGVTLCIFIFF